MTLAAARVRALLLAEVYHPLCGVLDAVLSLLGARHLIRLPRVTTWMYALVVGEADNHFFVMPSTVLSASPPPLTP